MDDADVGVEFFVAVAAFEEVVNEEVDELDVEEDVDAAKIYPLTLAASTVVGTAVTVASIHDSQTPDGARMLLGTMEPDLSVEIHRWSDPDVVYP